MRTVKRFSLSKNTGDDFWYCSPQDLVSGSKYFKNVLETLLAFLAESCAYWHKVRRISMEDDERVLATLMIPTGDKLGVQIARMEIGWGGRNLYAQVITGNHQSCQPAFIVHCNSYDLMPKSDKFCEDR